MTQKQKDLLLKDLCGRVPYNPKFTFGNNVYTLDGIFECVNAEWVWVYCIHAKGIEPIEIELCKPYLFPLSSMTEEQRDIYGKLWWNAKGVNMAMHAIDFFNKHHFDYRGLIKKGLAIDATGKNIY